MTAQSLSQRCIAAALLASALSLACQARADIVLDPLYVNDYTFNSLGGVAGVPSNLGGLAFKPGDPNTLLIMGGANGPLGKLYSIGVVRSCTGQITGFKGTGQYVCDAASNDGGLDFAPNGVLFHTTYPINHINQVILPATTPAKIVDLSPPGVWPSVGTLRFVPAGFAGAGRLKLASFNGSTWYDATIVPDGLGTYDITNITFKAQLVGGPEGVVYINGNAPQFAADSVLVCEWNVGKVASYEIDANGDPIPATRHDFLTGLNGAEGAVIDPLTGDFLFSTYGGGNQVVVVHGFGLPCASDIAPPGGGNGVVNIDDLLRVINNWSATCTPIDITGNGVVNIDDLLAVINQWGPCQ
jgi:hypothetical protein